MDKLGIVVVMLIIWGIVEFLNRVVLPDKPTDKEEH